MSGNESSCEDLEQFREWTRNHPNLPSNVPDEQLSLFLHSCYYDMELAKKAMAKYYTMKTNMPEFFSGRLLSSPGLTSISKVVQICSLPNRTEAGYWVICSRLTEGMAANMFCLEEAIKFFFMVVDTHLAQRPVEDQSGLLFLFDNAGLTFSHLMRMNISSVKKYLAYVQEAMPVRLKSIHVVNVTPLLSYAMDLIRPFIRKEYFKYIHFYTSDKVKNIHNYIQEDILPKDYGGKGASMDTLYNDTLSHVKANEDWFKADETLRMTETKENKPSKKH